MVISARNPRKFCEARGLLVDNPPAVPIGLLVLAGLMVGGLIVVGLTATGSRFTTRARQPPSGRAQLDRPKPVSEGRHVPPPGEATQQRILSQIDTTIEHRWHRGTRLNQTVTLRVHPNSRAGYRTYSQMTVSPARAGDWRVELRAANGAVPHEERCRVGQ